MATSQDFANYICGPRIQNRYLMHLLRFLQPEWNRLMAGSTHNTIYMPVFENLQVLLPPIDEQQRIAAILSAVDGAIEATQAVIDQLQVVKKATMAELLTSGLPGRHTRFKQTEIGLVPQGWDVVHLSALIAKGPDNGLYKPQADYGDGTPIVRIDAFDNGDVIEGRDLRRVRASRDEIERFGLRAGDIIVNRVNSLSHIAKVAIVGDLAEPTVFESNMMRFAVDTQKIVPAYAFLVISSPAAKAYFVARAKQAVAQASVNQGDIRALQVPLPALDEQIKLSRIAEALEDRIAVEINYLGELAQAKSALMSVLLTGEVRVTLDEEAA
jgi:type I restriction enzyme S subunit